jgi:hypothetical protein
VECGLQIFKMAIVGQAFNRVDSFAICLNGQDQTTPDNPAIKADRTGTADTMLAAYMGTG